MDHPGIWDFYMISFMLVEKISTETHLIHSFVDDLIPFCEYFIYSLCAVVSCSSRKRHVFCIGKSGQKRVLSVYGDPGCGNDSVSYYLLCVSQWPESQTELTGEVLLFRLCSFCTRQIPPQIFFRVFMYLMQLPVVWLF